MKAAIIAFNNLRISPYVKTYSSYLDKKGIEYDVIYPNRLGIEEDFEGGAYVIPWNPKRHKIFNFLSFARRAKRILKRNRYDFVFVLTTIPAVLLSGFLKKHYNGRYLVDIRDYTHENKGFFYKREKVALNCSAINIISAPGFKSFLPKADYIFCPNISDAYREGRHTFTPGGEPIKIAYVGTVAYAENCKRLIDLVLKDERFRFDFYGNELGSMPVTSYINELGSSRIVAHGGYVGIDKPGIILGTDILFNVYGNDRMLVKYALSNKLYDGMYFKKPILVSSNTEMQTEAGEYSFAVDFEDENILSKLYDWYYSIDGESFNKDADEYISKAYSELDRFYARLDECVTGACEVEK